MLNLKLDNYNFINQKITYLFSEKNIIITRTIWRRSKPLNGVQKSFPGVSLNVKVVKRNLHAKCFEKAPQRNKVIPLLGHFILILKYYWSTKLKTISKSLWCMYQASLIINIFKIVLFIMRFKHQVTLTRRQ